MQKKNPDSRLKATCLYLSLILLVLVTSSMSIRILYVTCDGSFGEEELGSIKTTPAQNCRSSSSSKARSISWPSVRNPSSLFREKHWWQTHKKNQICNSNYNLLLLDRRVWGREVPLWLVRELWWCGWCHCRCPARLSELRGSLECPARAWTGSVQYGRRSRTCSPGASWPAPPLPAASTDPVIHTQTWVFFLLPNDKHNALIDGSGWVLTRSSWISTLLSM